MDQEESIQELSKIYDMVEKFICMKEYEAKLQEELTAACPNYLEVLKASKRDLTRSDCGIVVTGETSAGKTSLINLITQCKKLFVTSNLAATGKVCRIRNSEKMSLTLYEKDESLIKKETANDTKTLKKIVQKYTDISECPEEFKNAYFVDVCLPVPLLQGNVIIVDTPGIGGTEEFDQILMDFLPYAVSFIFVVNAQNAGGIHEDRLLKIIRTIIEKREQMPCFEPSHVLFLTNKWDCIDDDSSDEDDSDEGDDQEDQRKKLTEKEKTWQLIQTKLRNGWGLASDDKIFRCSLKQITKGMKNEFSEEYARFERVLTETVKMNQNKRLRFYFSFLVNFTKNAERGTLARITLLERSEEEQREIIKKHRKQIKEIESECKSKNDILQQKKRKRYNYNG